MAASQPVDRSSVFAGLSSEVLWAIALTDVLFSTTRGFAGKIDLHGLPTKRAGQVFPRARACVADL